jgi:translation elongation factor EF-Tu-like GTPase
MTVPPMVPNEPQLWMTVNDVFSIKGRGTVLTGRLEGNLPLNVGDILVCDGQRWPVVSIERFRALLNSAEPGSDVGVLVKHVPAGVELWGKTVQFVSSTAPFEGETTRGVPGKFWRRHG